MAVGTGLLGTGVALAQQNGSSTVGLRAMDPIVSDLRVVADALEGSGIDLRSGLRTHDGKQVL